MIILLEEILGEVVSVEKGRSKKDGRNDSVVMLCSRVLSSADLEVIKSEGSSSWLVGDGQIF